MSIWVATGAVIATGAVMRSHDLDTLAFVWVCVWLLAAVGVLDDRS